ncbi:MAG: substrate-binding domain-containing protein [Planctomycetes bacterium]|nr:substrate-binding domain-containing protein [Planctomycetota bacterium]
MIRWLAAACVVCIGLSGGRAAAGETTVYFIPKLTGNAFFDSANEGVQRYADRHGFAVRYHGRPEATVANQIALIEEAVAAGADAICISSVDATMLDDALRTARAAGVATVTWDSDVSGDARTVMVSQGTPEILARMLVDMAADALTARDRDPKTEAIRYVWHYSQSTVADQNSWNLAGEDYINDVYPQWVNVAPTNYYSEQDLELAVRTGERILAIHPDIDLVICNDSTALPGQCQAMKNTGRTMADVTVTGFASPNAIKDYCREGILERWGLWDCRVQGWMGCYLAFFLAQGNGIGVGQVIDIPDIGPVEVHPNTVLDPTAADTGDSGVVLLPERVVFTRDTMDAYDF